jgi:multiple antibiotic resistance protein
MDIIATALLLFLIIDPIGNVPVFLGILRGMDPRRRYLVIARELLFALGVMLLFLFAGGAILGLLQLHQEALSIAGGIILFLIALRMIFPSEYGPVARDEDPFFVPLAVPLVAGPSVIAALLLLVSREPDRLVEWVIALGLAWAASAVILLASSSFYRVFSERGLRALERLMGMLLVLLSVQMFLDGVREFVRSL